MPKKTTSSTVAAFQKLLAGGATIAEAAKTIGIGLSTAYGLPREEKQNPEPTKARTKLSKQEIATARSMFEGGAKQKDVAAALGRSKSSISALRGKMRISHGRKANPNVAAAQEALKEAQTPSNGAYVLAVNYNMEGFQFICVSSHEVGAALTKHVMAGAVVKLFKPISFSLTAEVL